MSSADEIGRLAWMTPQSQAAALANADASRPFDLAVDYFMGMPAWTRLGDPKYDIWLTHTPQGEGHEYAGTAISMPHKRSSTQHLRVAMAASARAGRLPR